MAPPIRRCFRGQFDGRTVLVTGHTGFKGSWLSFWLNGLGAKVIGYSLAAPTTPNHYGLLNLSTDSHIADVRDLSTLRATITKARPEVIFHLAAQPLVRLSYQQPVETFTSNVTGTLNVLEAARSCDSVRAIICITSDKVYENHESAVGYHENDRLGGADPYSASKACSELVIKSYRQSFFPLDQFEKQHSILIATARAGNVIGGGDWASDRLVADAVRAASSGQVFKIRNPSYSRPWQHVLEPLAGYLSLADGLLQGKRELASAFNFGPVGEDHVSVLRLVEEMKSIWPAVEWEIPASPNEPHETQMLKLDSSLAQQMLSWTPIWNWKQAISQTTCWYRSFYESRSVDSQSDLEQFVSAAYEQGANWAIP